MKTCRIFIEKNSIQAGCNIMLSSAELHYLKNVMRLKNGDELRIFNGTDGEWITKLCDNSTTPIKKIREQNNQRSIKITLCFASVKNHAIKNIIRQATELDISILQPIYTKNTVVKIENIKKFHPCIKEATEQCERMNLPQILQPITLSVALDKYQDAIICDERYGGKNPELRNMSEYVIITGPEGGFTEDEKYMFRNHTKISLGSNILRCDTAAAAALCYIKFKSQMFI